MIDIIENDKLRVHILMFLVDFNLNSNIIKSLQL